jgi:hypothetical protein
MLRDPEEKIRVRTIKVVGELIDSDAIDQIDGTVIDELGKRMLDKKVLVREEAIRTLARLYNVVFEDL